MNNKINLTDDELSLIATSLQMTIMANEKYIQMNGEQGLDFQTKEAMKEMRALYDKLNREYF